MIKGTLLGFFCFLLFVCVHIFIFHNFIVKRRFFFMAKLFLFILMVYITLFIFIPASLLHRYFSLILPVSLLGYLNGAFLHYFFFHFYLHFIQIIDRSPCTRILVEIDNSQDKKLTLEQLKQKYSLDRKLKQELEDMVIFKRLNKYQNRYSITKKGILHCRIFKFIREYLKLEKA